MQMQICKWLFEEVFKKVNNFGSLLFDAVDAALLNFKLF